MLNPQNSNTSYVAINPILRITNERIDWNSNTSYVAINRLENYIKGGMQKFKYIVCCY